MAQPRIISAIKTLQKGIETTANSMSMMEDEIATDLLLINERINTLERKRRDQTYMTGTARNQLEGETMSKYWVRSAKENTPRDTVRVLRNPLGGTQTRATHSDEMEKIVRDYHEALLMIDRDPLQEVN